MNFEVSGNFLRQCIPTSAKVASPPLVSSLTVNKLIFLTFLVSSLTDEGTLQNHNHTITFDHVYGLRF